MAGYLVTAAAVLIPVGQYDRLFERGAVVSEDIAPEVVERLVTRGMVAPAGRAVIAPEVLVGDALEGLTVAQLRDYANSHGVEIEGLSRKAELQDAIRAAAAPVEPVVLEDGPLPVDTE